ncbi:MAG: response regulator [Phycisphaerae bacterium]|nr:response regulator [Phycisphaerae bacterium]
MTPRAPKIMLVVGDPALLELIVAALSRRIDAQITCVPDASTCLDVELSSPHDLVIADLDPPNENILKLCEELRVLSSRPIILMGGNPSRDETLAALRLGVRDLFIKPFPVVELLDAAERALLGQDLHRRHVQRHRKLRELVRRMVRDRREMNRRVELICRDLVGAHRRLVQRVLAREQTQAAASS